MGNFNVCVLKGKKDGYLFICLLKGKKSDEHYGVIIRERKVFKRRAIEKKLCSCS